MTNRNWRVLIKVGVIECTLFSDRRKTVSCFEGDVITVEKIAANEGDVVTFDQVLTVVNDADVKVGTPVVEGAKITAKVEKQDKARKILVFKYKAKSNYRRRQGHRQPFTKLTIEKSKHNDKNICNASR